MGTAGSSLSAPCAGSYLGRGIYDVAEVARLIRPTRGRVEWWTRAGADKVPLLSGELDGLFSFWDLLSLRVVGELVERGSREARSPEAPSIWPMSLEPKGRSPMRDWPRLVGGSSPTSGAG
ncbi:MAG: hypothetical protein OXF99_05685 [bacterium]|nr:hypothetical protein [bacterium]